ncbi:MAG: hypothetical protein LBN10_11055 [Propionibacteriaceae bacterium]|jgi:hypothetical protein|nr:hypothetical protein [Propionibacteriaceae bacterium]
MTWFWQPPADLTNRDLAEDMSLGWESREDAESWLTGAYEDLLAEDVHELTLLDGDQAVYTMALDEEAGL